MKRFLIETSRIFPILVVICGVIGLSQLYFYYALSHGLTRADPYPAFMTELQPKGTRSYQQAEQMFSEFVVRTFPIGSNAKEAIVEITREGFRVMRSTPDSVELRWNRAAGPCSEQYFIMINQNADGVILKKTGNLHPVCL
jgi:hypothetical protein